MKIIDFHTHYYPDRIAESAIASMEKQSGLTAPLAGSRAALLQSMTRCGVTCSVVLPVATKPEKAHSINEKNAQIDGKDGIRFAGAIHPDCEDVEAELDFIKECGFFGIKLHPDYQNAYFDDPRYLRILEGAASRGLIIVTHAGADPGYPGCPVRCTPDRILNVMKEMGSLLENQLVLAHLGGTNMVPEVLDKLIGLPVWMDTAYVLDRYPQDCLEIIRKQSPSRILFGTDSPWTIPSEYIRILRQMPLGEKDLEKILWRNAEQLLSAPCGSRPASHSLRGSPT